MLNKMYELLRAWRICRFIEFNTEGHSFFFCLVQSQWHWSRRMWRSWSAGTFPWACCRVVFHFPPVYLELLLTNYLWSKASLHNYLCFRFKLSNPFPCLFFSKILSSSPWNSKHILGADIFPAEPALQIAWTVQLCLLVTVLGPGVRLIWKDFLHSKKQQDLITVRDPLRRAARLFKEPLSPGTFKNLTPWGISKKKTHKETLHSKEDGSLDLLDLFHHWILEQWFD